ncbi:MAG: metallophosphoesterase family protein [Candidatus Hydrogenedentes bacterium]|nr:metallophosphoesterase family protein [Candidatus Hydrogenedentota bacterium]
MKYAIISDIHANLQALIAVLDKIDNIGVDQVVCLGDVVGYNGNPNECVEMVRERQIPTICGNHDAVACGASEPWGFNPVALAAAIWTRENLKAVNLDWLRSLPNTRRFEHFLAVHGSPMDRDTYMFSWEDVIPHLNFLKEQEVTVCFFGHTHCPGIFSADSNLSIDTFEDATRFMLEENKTYLINPGSVGQPRDGDRRAAFGLFDTDTREYELVRVSYPIKLAAEKVIEVGLPQFLAERLSLGR